MTESDMQRRLANQRASLESADAALADLRNRLTESERQRALLSDLLDRERDKTAEMARRLDRIANALQVVRDARCARPSPESSTKPTTP